MPRSCLTPPMVVLSISKGARPCRSMKTQARLRRYARLGIKGSSSGLSRRSGPNTSGLFGPNSTSRGGSSNWHYLYRVPEIVTRGRFPDGGESDSTWRTRRLVMSAPTPLRQDFDAPQVRGLARKTKDGPQARRLLALAAIYDGATRTEAAKIGGVGLQIIRDWVLRFNARGPDGLLDGKSTGQPSTLNDTQRQAIA